VHPAPVVILGHRKARAATARDEEHARILFGLRSFSWYASLHYRESRIAVTAGICRASLGLDSRGRLSLRERISLRPSPSSLSSAYSIAGPFCAAAALSA
jgi:hypothetical protein